MKPHNSFNSLSMYGPIETTHIQFPKYTPSNYKLGPQILALFTLVSHSCWNRWVSTIKPQCTKSYTYVFCEHAALLGLSILSPCCNIFDKLWGIIPPKGTFPPLKISQQVTPNDHYENNKIYSEINYSTTRWSNFAMRAEKHFLSDPLMELLFVSFTGSNNVEYVFTISVLMFSYQQ